MALLLESDLEEMMENFLLEPMFLKENYHNNIGNKDEFIVKRQFTIGRYGICDLITLSRPKYNVKTGKHSKIKITIYELKKGELNVEALMQVATYSKGVERWLVHNKQLKDYEIKCVLVGSEIQRNSWVYLSSQLLDKDKIKIYKYNIDYNGLYLIPVDLSTYCKSNEFGEKEEDPF